MKAKQNFRIVPPRHGLVWLVNSFSLLKLQPVRLFFVAVVMQFILSLSSVNLIGFLVVLAIPGLSAGMLETLRRVSTGLRPMTSCLFVPLSSGPHVARFLALGGIIFFAGAASIMLFLSGGENTLDPEILQRIEQGDTSAVALLDPAVVQRLLMAVTIGVAISGTLSFFSIPLLWFRNMSLGLAIRTGVSALMANWKPFLVMGVSLLALSIPVMLVLGMVFGAGGGSLLGIAAVLFLMLGFQLVMFATQYCSFIDIFPDQAKSQSDGSGSEDNEEQSSDDSGEFIA